MVFPQKIQRAPPDVNKFLPDRPSRSGTIPPNRPAGGCDAACPHLSIDGHTVLFYIPPAAGAPAGFPGAGRTERPEA
jgi:hypothetical protein